MRRLIGLLALVAITAGLPASSAAGEPTVESTGDVPSQSSTLHLRIEVQPGGDLEVHETIELSFGGDARPPLTRQLWLRPVVGMFPLRQRVSKLRVTDEAGAAIAHRVRRLDSRMSDSR